MTRFWRSRLLAAVLALGSTDAQPTMLAAAGDPLRLDSAPAELSLRSGERREIPLTLPNGTGNELTWQLVPVDPGGRSAGLDDVLAGFIASSAGIVGTIPARVSFPGGESGTQIDAGGVAGSNPFAGGNLLRTNLGGPLAYSDRTVVSSSLLGSDGRYFTLKLPGLFLFCGDADGPATFEIGGSASANTLAYDRSITLKRGGYDWIAHFVTRSGSSSQPAAHQVVLVEGPGSATTPHSATSGSTNLQTVTRFGGKRRIVMATFGTPAPSPPTSAEMDQFARALLAAIPEIPRSITVEPGSGTIAAGAEGSSSLLADAVGLDPGRYSFDLEFRTPQATTRKPVTLVVGEPELKLSTDHVWHAGVDTAPADRFEIGTSADASVPWSARLLDGGPWISLPVAGGVAGEPVALHFDPKLAGGTRDYSCRVEITTPTSTYHVPVSYAVDRATVSTVFTHPLFPRAYALHTGSFAGAVLVVDPLSGAILKTVRVARGPADLDFSPDENAAYIISGSVREICRFDTVADVVTARMPVPNKPYPFLSSPHVAAGRGGRLYFSGAEAGASLRLIRFPDPEPIDVLTAEEFQQVASAPTAVGDIHLDLSTNHLLVTVARQNTSIPLVEIETSGDRLKPIAAHIPSGGNGLQSSGSPIFLGLNGDTVIVDRFAYPRNSLEDGKAIFPDPAVAISAYGDLVASRSDLREPAGGTLLSNLAGGPACAFTPDQSGLISFGSTSRTFRYLPIPTEIAPPPVEVRHQPRDGHALPSGETTLRWSPLPFVDSYRVYFGSNEDEVTSAVPGSPSDRGLVAGASFTLDPPPPIGNYFWRVDAVRGGEIIAGEVVAVGIAPFRVDPAPVDVTAPAGALPQVVRLAIQANSEQDLPWSLSGDAPWIKFARATGPEGEAPELQLDPDGLAVRVHKGSAFVSSGGFTVEIPATLRLFAPVIQALVPDPARPVVYGLNRGSGLNTPAYVVAIDAPTGRLIRSWHFDSSTPSMALHPAEDRLYVPMYYRSKVHSIDLATGQALPPMSLNNWDTVGTVVPGRKGRIFIQNRSDRSVLHLFDTDTRRDLGAFPSLEPPYDSSDEDFGALYRADRQQVWRIFRDGLLQAIDVSTDSPAVVSSTVTASGYNNVDPWIVMNPAGDRVIANRSIRNGQLVPISLLDSVSNALSGDGQIFATATAVHWSDSGSKAADLPPNLQSVVFSSDDRHLLAWDQVALRVISLPVDSLVDLPGPFPRPEQQFDDAPPHLSWSPVPGAGNYRIYLGSTAAEVRDALPTSAVLLGQTSRTSFDLPDGLLETGSRTFWRVEALGADGQVLAAGTTRSFDVRFAVRSIDPGPQAMSLGEFTLLTDHGVMAGGWDEARLFQFDPATGTTAFQQSFPVASMGPPINLGVSLGILSVASDGRQILFGTPGYSRTQSGQDYNLGRGLAFSTHRDEIWRRSHEIVAVPGAVSGLQFGTSVAFSGGLALVGEAGTSTARGTVHAYLPDSGWIRTSSFRAPDSFNGDFFGASLALDGNRAVIGSRGSRTGFNRRARAFVFEHDPQTGSWNPVAALDPTANLVLPDTARAVAIQGKLAAVANIATFASDKTASVVLFDAALGWKQSATIRAADIPGASGLFGTRVALDGDLLLVGDPGGTWKNSPAGVVWVFRITDSAWSALPPIVPDATNSALKFGKAIAARDGWLIVAGTGVTDPPRLARTRPEANRRPYFTSPPVSHLAAGLPFDIPLAAHDPDGDAVTFSVLAGPEWLSLQTDPGGRARLVGTPPIAAAPAPLFQIEVTDSRGGRDLQTTEPYVLSDPVKPVISGLADRLQAGLGQDLTFQPVIAGSSPMNYQWLFQGEPIPGETEPLLTLRNLSDADSGSYSLMVTNPVSTVDSPPVVLVVRSPGRDAGDWTTFGGNDGRTGHHPATLGPHHWSHAWSTPELAGSYTYRTVIADRQVIANISQDPNGFVAAFALETGIERWRNSYALDRGQVGSPTYFEGRVYLQRTGSGNGYHWAIDALTGGTVWTAVRPTTSNPPEAPAVGREGIFFGSGIQGIEFSGSQRFSAGVPAAYNATPTLVNGHLYRWGGGVLGEYRPADAIPIWSLNLGEPVWFDNGRAPVVSGDTAVVRGDRIYCVDLPSRSLRWSLPLPDLVQGDPALDGDRVYVLDRLGVQSFDRESGLPGPRYKVLQDVSAIGQRLVGQPLVLNDHVVISNTSKTWIFDRETAALVQELPAGGLLSYSKGYLVLSGSRLHAWKANTAPAPTAYFEQTIRVEDSAPDGILPLGSVIRDPDGDAIVWEITSVSRPEIFRKLELHPTSGDLEVIYNPWQSGTSTVGIATTDATGNRSETTLTFTVPAHPAPALGLAVKLVLNRQTGLYEHLITVTNSGAREVAGFDLAITGLPAGVVLNNASGNDGTNWTVQHRKPLAAGASVTLVLEYYTPVRGTVINPQVAVRLVTEPESDPAAGVPGLAVDRCEVLADGLLIEFTTVPGRLYEIQYSDNTRDWKVSPIHIRAAGNRTQWIDRGPPRTDSRPQDKASRFYRVREMPAAAGP